MKKDNIYYMEMALKLASKAKAMTSPNPMVGAVVVKNNRIIGKGYHEKAGQPHAEIIALEEAGQAAKGSSLYVTLEPCTHFGKTPPCVDRIIQLGVKEVVIGIIDPNPLNNGKGVKILKNHRINVKVGFLEEKLRKLNEVFIKYITKRLPFVTVKAAQSLDGKIATKSGESRWITSDKSRIYSHRMRQFYDAIMVGENTVLRDNPKLNAWFAKRQPIKIVVDSHLSTPQDASIFAGNSRVIIFTLPSKPGQEIENRKMLSGKATIIDVKEKSGEVNLKDMMKRLAQMGIVNILVEGGGTLIGSLFDEGLVDKIMFFISPKIIGGKEAISSVMGQGINRLDSAIRLKDMKLRRFKEDIFVEAYVR